MDKDYKIVNIKDWRRKNHFHIFRDYVEPFYSVSFELTISNFVKEIREHNYSFTMSLIYIITKCANEVEEFRYRFLGDDVVSYNKINTSFTYMQEGDSLFKVINVDMQDSLEEYIRAAEQNIKNQQEYFNGPPGIDVFQFSPMPWISYTHISHTISGRKGNATPIFDWGKYFMKDDQTILPFSVHVHHSFVDGIHVGNFAEILQKCLSEFTIKG